MKETAFLSDKLNEVKNEAIGMFERMKGDLKSISESAAILHSSIEDYENCVDKAGKITSKAEKAGLGDSDCALDVINILYDAERLVMETSVSIVDELYDIEVKAEKLSKKLAAIHTVFELSVESLNDQLKGE